MKKELLREYLTQEIAVKNSLLASNTIGEDDRTTIETRIAELNALVEKVDAIEDEAITIEAVDGLKEALNGLSEKLEAINEKLNQREEEKNTETMVIEENNYLQSQNSMHDFAEAIRHSKTADEFRANWSDKLTANGITITEGSESAFLPDPVKGLINDIWDRDADWLKDLNNTGAKRFYCRHNTSDQNAETSRAKGHKKGDTKVSQTINLAAKMLNPQFIYKLQAIDTQTIFENDEALITYVISELMSQVLFEIKRAILTGDGRANDSDYKISSFEAIVKDTTDAYTTVSTVTANGFLIDDMVASVNTIVNPNNRPVYAFMSKTDLTALRRVSASSTSTPVYVSREQIAEMMGVDRIIDTDLLGSDVKAVFMTPSEYYMVGENILSPVLMTQHDIYKNQDIYRMECAAGGGINAMKSTAVLLAE